MQFMFMMRLNLLSQTTAHLDHFKQTHL